MVLFEPVRSAEPPMVAGIAALIASSAISDALRVATGFRSASSLSRYGLSHASLTLPFEPGQELVLAAALLQPLLPLRMLDRAALARRAPGGEHVVGNGEFVGLESELLARRLDLVLAERGTVGRGGPLLVGRAEADDRLAADQARARVGRRFLDRAADVVGVEAVAFARCAIAPPDGGRPRPRCATDRSSRRW